MAWETALDRLATKQIHLAERGEIRAREIEELLLDLRGLAPERSGTAFLSGYARALLGLDLPEPANEPDLQRWYRFGRIRGHDRRGERNWVADLVQDSAVLMDLLQDASIAAQCLPLVMRTLFWCEDLSLAVKALEFLASDARSREGEVLVDAALSDLVARLEVREDREDNEPTATILEKCIQLPCLERLPADVRARYFRALANRQLAASEFEEALGNLRIAHALGAGAARLQSSVAALAVLGCLRLHSLEDLEPRAEREERDAANAWLEHVDFADAEAVPQALFAAGILGYEVGAFDRAQQCFDLCLGKLRRVSGRDVDLINRTRFFLAASILAGGARDDASRAVRLMELALDQVCPDLESFYPVHEALKELDRKIALKFLDAVEIGRGTAPDQLLFVALEYLSLAEAGPAADSARRVLQIAVNLDQRVEAMRVLLTAHNMQGDRDGAREAFFEMRDMLAQRGAFDELDNLLQDEESVGQALDHVEVKCERVALYEEMEGRELDRAVLQTQIARSLRARKDADSLQQAFGLLKEVEVDFPDLAKDELGALEKLIGLAQTTPANPQGAAGTVARWAEQLGRAPLILVVGGNERQRRHHPRFEQLAKDWGFVGEWLMANYTSPQKVVSQVQERLRGGLDLLVLLHWNRHETTEPALELARREGVPARTVHYAGFTSLQVCLADMLEKAMPAAAAGRA
ncbi:MAG: hypothetical protein AAF628_03720 [Planctomycetota bacterium]